LSNLSGKMKKLIKHLIISNVIITLLMFPLVVSSQNLDSLWTVWNDDSQADSARLKAINRFLWTRYNQTPISNDSLLMLSQNMYDLAVKAGLKKQQSNALRHLGFVYRDRYNYPKALEYYEQRLSLCTEINYLRGIGETYKDIARILTIEGRYKEALTFLKKSLKKYKEISDSIGMAMCLNRIGMKYYQLSDNNMARSYFESSIGMIDTVKEHTLFQSFKSSIAKALASQGEYEKALPILIKRLNYHKTLGDYAGVAVLNEYIGAIYEYQGKYDLAYALYQESLEIFQQEANKHGMAYILGAISRINKDQGNFIKALEYLKRSENLWTEINNRIGIAVCVMSYGEFYSDLENYDVSLGYLQTALELFEEIGNNALIADAYSLIGGIYLKLADYSQSYKYYEMSLSIYMDLDMKSEIAAVYNKLGIYFKELDNYKNAQDYLIRSKEIYEEIGHKKGMAEVYIWLGDLNYQQGNLSNAIDWCKKGYDIAIEIGVLTLEQKAANCLYKGHDLVYQDSISQERNSRNIFIFVGLGVLLLAVGIFSRMVFVRRTNKELERRNKIISKEKERAEASEKAKEQFFNNISHEFRTPLTLILGPLDEALEKTSDDRIKPGLQIMQRNALRLQEMINELLDLSKLEFGKVKLLAKEENIVKLTEDYLQSFESLADQRRIKLKFKSDAKEYKAWIDAEKFEKILANLLSNAFKYTNPKGEIRVNISSQLSRVSNISGELPSNKGVYVTVSDSGIGIAKENLPHIFDRFFQVGEPSQAHHAGTGIGLALAKELVGFYSFWSGAFFRRRDLC